MDFGKIEFIFPFLKKYLPLQAIHQPALEPRVFQQGMGHPTYRPPPRDPSSSRTTQTSPATTPVFPPESENGTIHSRGVTWFSDRPNRSPHALLNKLARNRAHHKVAVDCVRKKLSVVSVEYIKVVGVIKRAHCVSGYILTFLIFFIRADNYHRLLERSNGIFILSFLNS